MAEETPGEARVSNTPLEAAELAFARSEMIEHEWVRTDGSRAHVAFCLSYSTAPQHRALAADSVADNWGAAVQRARAICEAADPFDEQGVVECETMLCGHLTPALFPSSADAPLGAVERVIWKRLMWH